MSQATRPGAGLTPIAPAVSRPGRPRSLNAPDTAGEFSRPWQPLSRKMIRLAAFDLMEPGEV